MLSSIFSHFKASPESPLLKVGKDMHEMMTDVNGLGSEDSAQFSAGFLYGWSNGTVDERDYIVGCYDENKLANFNLVHGFANYEIGEIDAGNWYMDSYLPWTKWAMRSCSDTRKYFRQIGKQKR